MLASNVILAGIVVSTGYGYPPLDTLHSAGRISVGMTEMAEMAEVVAGEVVAVDSVILNDHNGIVNDDK